ncbi:bi-domain-containing oxidoreductase [Sphingorhabdus sp. EL138]|uniref:bi-domain-containing oxidoreductase n=1 Tax=Sphingorhabdus sp. EL138 TaxID=2073156 RepID=UPI000D6914D7|nr:bi-domain-containing oxidoreductase [Sphingorhabdus sp. EL138]
MKQIVQYFSTGETQIVDAPDPAVGPNDVLIRTSTSLISAGTERMLVDFGKASLLQKARKQPERVADVLNKVKTDGLMTTVDAVRSKLGQPIPLGYSNVGVVIDVGSRVTQFAVGDRVVSNGPHADVVRVSQTLCAPIPSNVSNDTAAFVVIGSIGLQGIRLAQPTLGEAIVVTGAGLVGLLTIQLLIAQGCRVLAIDFDQNKLEIAKGYGAEICNPSNGEDPIGAGMAFSRGRGVDAVIITASTESTDPVTQAAQMSRKRGRIVLVGVTGLNLNRSDFYEKELSFQVSCSYGPGRYDPEYEEKGNDYPAAFVRWTEGRNFEAILDMMERRAVSTDELISSRFSFENAVNAYDRLTSDKSSLGMLLDYPPTAEDRVCRTIPLKQTDEYSSGAAVVGFIGAGNYASRILIPAFQKAGAKLDTIVSSGGLSGSISGTKAGFAKASSDVDEMLTNDAINVVAIATRHDSHADLTVKALNAGKHVFVEKPLGLTRTEVSAVEEAYAQNHSNGGNNHLMVGYNRRFAPQILKMKSLLEQVNEPKSFLMVMNAGAIPAEHWTQDPDVGGGRIIGEACHFIDLMRFLADSPIVSSQGRTMGKNHAMGVTTDKASITLGFEDGSFGTIMYLANGAASFPKERIEVFAAGRTLQLDNFRSLKAFGWPGFSKMNLARQNKGQEHCPKAFLAAIANGSSAIPAEQIFEVARVTVDVANSLRDQ